MTDTYKSFLNETLNKIRREHDRSLTELETKKEAEFEKERSRAQALIKKLKKLLREDKPTPSLSNKKIDT